MALIVLTNVLTDDVSALIVNTNNNASALNTDLSALSARMSLICAFNATTIVVSGTIRAQTALATCGTLTASGGVTFNSTMTVTSTGHFSGNVEIAGSAKLSSTLTVTSNVLLSSTLSVVSQVTISGGLTVMSHVAISATLSVTGSAMFAGPVTFSGAAHFSGTATFTQGFTLSGQLTAGSILSVAGSANFTSTISAAGSAVFTRQVSMAGSLTITLSSVSTQLSAALRVIQNTDDENPDSMIIGFAVSRVGDARVVGVNRHVSGRAGFILRNSAFLLFDVYGPQDVSTVQNQGELRLGSGSRLLIRTTGASAPIEFRTNDVQRLMVDSGGVSIASGLTLGSALYMPYMSTTTSVVVSTAQTVSMGTSCVKWLIITVSGTEYRVPLFSAS